MIELTLQRYCLYCGQHLETLSDLRENYGLPHLNHRQV